MRSRSFANGPTCVISSEAISVSAEETTRWPRSHEERVAHLESCEEPVVALPTRYADGERIPDHRHSRSQLLYARSGLATVTTSAGRWMVPPDHALWIPAETVHAVDILGEVRMLSVYVKPDALRDLPSHLHVAALTPLMRELIVAVSTLSPDVASDERAAALMTCLLHEIPQLQEKPLGLPFPSSHRLAELCRAFVREPSRPVAIDQWAASTGMSRRSFTRLFRRQTGLSLTTWRQQACLMAALPRLTGGERVTDVALDLGYESVPAFTTMFRRMLGASPKAYLKRLEG